MKKSEARSYGATSPSGRFILYWICPLMNKPECYVKLLIRLSTNVSMQAVENGR